MFLLFINIDHLKLLKRDKSFQLKEIEEELGTIISRWGGEKSTFSPFISIHPDSFNHSRNWVLNCINSITSYLGKLDSLVGFSIILDKIDREISEDVVDSFKLYGSRVTRVNSIWFTSSCLNFLKCKVLESRENMNLIESPVDIEKISIKRLDYDDLDRVGSSRYRYKREINYETSHEIIFWGEELGIDKVLLFHCSNEEEILLRFAHYLIANRSIFDPESELTPEEVEKWGVYIDFYNSLVKDDSGSWVLDSPEDHLSILIDLWLEAFCTRYKVLLIVNSTISNLPGINRENLITVFSNDRGENSFDISFVNSLDSRSLRVLYCALVTTGYISIDKLKSILTRFGYRGIYITELLEYFRIKGIFWGDILLYGNNRPLMVYLEKHYEDEIKSWSRELIDELTRENSGYLLSKLIISFSKNQLPDGIVHRYIDTTIDMGYKVEPSINFSKEMSTYATRRNNRSNSSLVEYKDTSSREITYLNISDCISRKELESVVQESKSLYMAYQQNEERYNESKSKVLFSMALIATGRVDEAIDYLELNANYSLSVNDYSSYIRSTCFLMVSMLIKGNLTGVIRVYNNNKVFPWYVLKTRWYLYSNFLAARAYGELGDYDDAIKLLEESLDIAKARKYSDAIRVINNWIGLFTAYSGSIQEGVDIIYRDPLNYESYYLLSIIEYMRGNLKSSLEFIDRSKREVTPPVIYDDRVDWRDGFSFVEELYVGDRTSPVIIEEINNFYNYIATLNGIDKKEALSSFSSMVPNDSTLVKDIKSLFYLYKLVQDDQAISGSSKEKFIDKSVRLIQQRGNNIDSHNRKVNYYNNFWNKIIMDNKR